jgi:hypothetical protein|tara:strand:+ start:225 stop:359 length:135 start_codon:yes stop_codon:yes gene_type:complete
MEELNMNNKHPWAKLSLKQIYANTRALKRIRKEMEQLLEMEEQL